MLTSKYAKGKMSLDVFEPKQGVYYIWKAIVNGSEVLKGLKWRIANGRTARFWVDAWVEDQPLKMLARVTILESLLVQKVEKCWVPDRGWNWSLFDRYLPGGTLLKMASMVVLESGEEVDILVLGDDMKRPFTVRKAYRCLSPSGAQLSRPG